MENSKNNPTTEAHVVYPWGNRQEKPIGQLDGDTFLSDRSLYNRNEAHDMQSYGHAKIIHTAPRLLFYIALVVSLLCTWAAVTAFNAWVRFDASADLWHFFAVTTTTVWYVFFGSLAASIAGFYVYNKLKRTWLDVFFTEAKIRFNVTQIDPLEVSKFQRSLRIVKNGRYTDL